MGYQITIVICTYNRADLVKKCLDSISGQVAQYQDVEVLLVDNNSTDGTPMVLEPFQAQGLPFHYAFEGKQGLSHARNKAMEVAKGTWLAYLDDDGMAHPDYLKRMKWVISQFDFDCFGGMYYAYYDGEKPKWIGENFGTKRLISNMVTEIHTDYLSGGNLVCKATCLKEVGGFSPDLGMKGNTMGYGEEDKMQNDLREAGYKIGFDPELKIDHLVAPYKLKPSWHIKRMYQMHRDKQGDAAKKYTTMFTLKRLASISLYDVPRFIKVFFTRKDYYRQNLYVDIGTKYAVCWGNYKNKYKRT